MTTAKAHITSYTGSKTLLRFYDPFVGRMLSADVFVQDPSSTQSLNRYSYCLNNPLKYTDPSGEFIGFVLAGAFIGGEIGGWIHSGTPALWNWKGDDWKAAGVGAMVGAGVGAGVAAYAGAAGTGLAVGGVVQNGVTASLYWNMISQALITANINMASTALQGGDLDQVFKNGKIGFAAGAIGGAVGYGAKNDLFNSPFGPAQHTNFWSQNAIKIQNYTTSSLNGFGTRFFNSDKEHRWKNGIIGSAESLYFTHYFGNYKGFTELGSFDNLGMYVSSAVSNMGSSVPGLGATVATYHLTGHLISSALMGAVGGSGFSTALSLVKYGGGLSTIGFANKYIFEDYPAIVKPIKIGFPWEW